MLARSLLEHKNSSHVVEIVLEILRFFETGKLGVSDVIYSRIINYIYQMVNISVNSRQKFLKPCMTIAIW